MGEILLGGFAFELFGEDVHLQDDETTVLKRSLILEGKRRGAVRKARFFEGSIVIGSEEGFIFIPFI